MKKREGVIFFDTFTTCKPTAQLCSTDCFFSWIKNLVCSAFCSKMEEGNAIVAHVTPTGNVFAKRLHLFEKSCSSNADPDPGAMHQAGYNQSMNSEEKQLLYM